MPATTSPKRKARTNALLAATPGAPAAVAGAPSGKPKGRKAQAAAPVAAEVKILVPAKAPAKPAPPKAAAAKRSAPSGGLSALDAAAQVLGALSAKEAAEGLSSQELIERMARARLWTSPSGKTPASTLYAAMIREAAARKGESRFRRVGPGRFTRAGVKLAKGARA